SGAPRGLPRPVPGLRAYRPDLSPLRTAASPGTDQWRGLCPSVAATARERSVAGHLRALPDRCQRGPFALNSPTVFTSTAVRLSLPLREPKTMPSDTATCALSLPRWRSLSADETDCHLSLVLEDTPLVRLRLERGDDLNVHLEYTCPERPQQALWAACYWLFSRDPGCQRLCWHLAQVPEAALASGLLVADEQAGRYRCERTLFWQLPQPWLGESLS